MKTKTNPLFFTLLGCSFLFLLLCYSKDCILLASNGLLVWYRSMIPTLFPFMVLSGFLVRTNISNKLGSILHPLFRIFLPLSSNMIYAVIMGFLCGFPMGAKIVADMMDKRLITPKEGQYLLSFCNNIGPLYMMGYVIPLFQYHNKWYVLIYMYSVPLLFGIIIRKKYCYNASSGHNKLIAASAPAGSKKKEIPPAGNIQYLVSFQDSLASAIEQITFLGGCMVFFNTLQIIPLKLISLLSTFFPYHQIDFFQGILSSLIEIGGGLQQLATQSTLGNVHSISPFLILSLLTFGGLSCMIQTLLIIKNTGLNILTYIKHKIIQSCIYILLFLLFS